MLNDTLMIDDSNLTPKMCSGEMTFYDILRHSHVELAVYDMRVTS